MDNTGVTLDQVMSLHSLLNHIHNSKAYGNTMAPIVSHMKDFIKCKNVTVFCFDKKYSDTSSS